MKNGVERDKHLRMIAVGMLHQTGDVLHGVGRFGAGAKGWAADIDGIRAVIDGFYPVIGIFCRCEQFEVFAGFLHVRVTT